MQAYAEDGLGYDPSIDPESDAAPVSVVENLRQIAEYPGNLADTLEEAWLKKLGAEVVREYAADQSSRKAWLDSVERAIKSARQTPEAKDYPFEKASNVKFPLLTTAAMQFNARCYGAITRNEMPVVVRPHGADPQGLKAAKASRVSRFLNYQLMEDVEEWDPGTDKLTFMLPVMGSGFRKVYWRTDLSRPALEFTSAKDVVVPNDAPSFGRAPRMTQPVLYYPHEILRMVNSGVWRQHRRETGGKEDDTQRPETYLEQIRYIDMDDDGLSEPYVVTVAEATEEVVRIEAAYYADSIRTTALGDDAETIVRESPWIDYDFLPDIEGSVYGMGFGQLLESLSGSVNTAINQMFDAAHRQNAGGGFISQGLRLRGGDVRIRPAEFLMVNTPGKVSDAIHELQFQGPSPVLFNLVEFLLGAAQDITSIKDVMTGDAPSGQAMGATLALIEQGAQVVTTIHKRIYRSMKREIRALMRLNQRFLSPQQYAAFFDDQGLQAAMLAQDFDLSGMDISPSADPRSITDMQRMARAQFLMPFLGQPGINNQEIQRRQFEAANLEDIDKLFVQGPDPMAMLAIEEKKADVALKKAQGVKAMQEAEGARQDAHTKAFERGTSAGIMAGGMGGMEGAADDAGVLSVAQDDGSGNPFQMDGGAVDVGGGPPT